MNKIFLALMCVVSTYAAQVVVVTGASRGIGLAIAKNLAQNGYSVYAGTRTHREGLPHEEKLVFLPLDVTNEESIHHFVDEILKKEDRIDVLGNNAGILFYGSVENTTIEEAKQLFDVNFFGAARMLQAVLPTMRTQGHGRIIQISSRSGFRPLPTLTMYAASKFALEGMSETMAALLGKWNIQVCLIEPGPVATDLDDEGSYGSHLPQDRDPYYPLFVASGLLEPGSPVTQQPEEIAAIVKEAIEAANPLFRYQTTEAIKEQAAMRFVDITGHTGVKELQNLLEKQ